MKIKLMIGQNIIKNLKNFFIQFKNKPLYFIFKLLKIYDLFENFIYK